MKRLMNMRDEWRTMLTDNARRLRLQFICIYAILAVVALLMTVVNIRTAKYLLMGSTLTFAILNIGNILLAKRSKRGLRISAFVFSVEVIALLTFFIVSGTPQGFSAIWICLVPSSGLLLFGRKRGTALCAAMFVIMLFLFETPLGNSFLQYPYTASFMLRFPMLYLAFFAVSFFLETVRAMTHDEMLKVKQQYEFLYSHDALTNVYNRYGFNEHMDALLHDRLKNETALMILDIDHFKNINDQYGHVNGDVVLQKVAETLVAQCGPNATVCRWGGEEFAVLFDGLPACEEMAESILNAIRSDPIEANGNVIRITVSIGIVAAARDEQVSPARFVTQADACMYRAKAGGRDRIVCERFATANA